MRITDGVIGPIAGLLDRIIPDAKARDAAKLELLKLDHARELETTRIQLSAIVAEAQSEDPWPAAHAPAFCTSCTRCCCGRSRWACSRPWIPRSPKRSPAA